MTCPELDGAVWGEADSDVFEQRFFLLYYLFRHYRLYRMPVHPLASGLCNWNELRGTNSLMDDLIAEFAWTGLDVLAQRGSVRQPLRPGLPRAAVHPGLARPMAEVLKLRLQGAPDRRDAPQPPPLSPPF